MSLMLHLPPELESELADEAARVGLPLAEYAVRVLARGRGPVPAPRNGQELLAYWQGEGLVGTRADIADSPTHARTLRELAASRWYQCSVGGEATEIGDGL
jgi:hypothetical protein